MTRVEPADVNDDRDEEEDESPIGINRICVMRRPRMVVQHAPIASASEPVASVVVADDAIDGVLRFSEPPPHDEWQPNNPRLSDIQGGASIVRTLFRRAKQEVRQFQSALAPVPPPQEFDSLRNLERMLTEVFGGNRSSRRPPPPRSSDPFQITIAESREGGADGSRVAARCAVSLKESAPVDEIDVTATLRASVLTDDNARVDEDIEFESLRIGGHAVAPESVFPLRLMKNEPVEIIARSVPFDSEWQAQVSLDVSAQSAAIPASQEQTE